MSNRWEYIVLAVAMALFAVDSARSGDQLWALVDAWLSGASLATAAMWRRES